MNNNLLFLLDLDDRTLFSNSIRSFFGFISKFIYKLFSGAIDLMYQLAAFDFGMNNFIETVSGRLFSILIIFMIFKVSISIMSYLVNPDIAIDKDKGFQSIIKRVIISIILLISINPIFAVLKDVEKAIIEDDIITTIFTASDDEKVITAGKERIVGVRMSPHCPSNKMIYTASKGDRIALLLFRPFLQPYGEDDIRSANDGDTAWDTVFSPDEGKDMAHYCGYDISSVKEIVLDLSGVDFKESFRDSIPGPNSAEGLLRDFYYNLGINEADTGYFANGDGTTSQYFFEFDYFFAFVLGIVGLLIVISFCFDVVIRSLNFIVLQMIAPIPIISYVSPQGKSSEMLSAWWKKVMSIWVSLFIRILCLSLAVLIIDGACNSLDNNDFGNASLLMQIFIILGVLMFAKKLPKLLEEIIPGLKIDGGFELNPLKRISKDAIGGKYVSKLANVPGGLVAAAGNLALQSGIQAGSNALAFGRNKHLLKKQLDLANKNGDTEKAAKFQRKLNRMSGKTGWLNLGSTVAGGALRGAYLGAGSGFKTGMSGSANIFKNIKGDTEKGNRSRNNAQNVFNFNSQLEEDLAAHVITEEEYNQQRYGWVERNIVERVDRNLGIKTEYGGYGYYDKKIGDLKKNIENLQLQEHAARNALAQRTDYSAQLEEIRKLMHEKGIAEAQALNDVANKFSMDINALTLEFNNNRNQLDTISYFDNETKKMKTEMKAYEEMLEAREAAKKG